MARICPETGDYVLYPECLECDTRSCIRADTCFSLLVAGTRTYEDYSEFSNVIALLTKNHKCLKILTGDAKGADALARRYASQHGLPLQVFAAHWDEYGKRAGYQRNRLMHEVLAESKRRGAVLFWDGVSRGTRQSIALAKEFGTPLRIWNFQTKSFNKEEQN